MTRAKPFLVPVVLCSLPLLAFVGCAGSRGKQAAFVEAQKSQLYSEDSVIAGRAALVLVSSQTEDAYRALRAALLEAGRPTTRAAVIRAFIAEKDDGIKAEALAAFAGEDETVRALAADYLVTVIRDDASGELLTVAGETNRPGRQRVAALDALGRIGSSDSVEGIIELLGDGDAQVAEAAVGALGEITYQLFGNEPETWRRWYRDNKKLGRQQWRSMWSSYHEQTTDLKSRISALEAGKAALEKETADAYKVVIDLAMQQQRYEAVIGVLRNASPLESQILAAEALGRAKVAQAGEILNEKARTGDRRLAEACINALGSIGYVEATDTVLDAMRRGDTGLKLAGIGAYSSLPKSDLTMLLPLIEDPASEVRAAVAKVIGARKWEGGVPTLVAMLSDPSSDVIVAATEALGQFGDRVQAQAAHLRGLVGHKDEKVRYAAVRSLTLLCDPASLEAFVTATRDHTNPRIREVAVVGLATFKDKPAVDRILDMVLNDPDPKVAAQAWASLQTAIGDDAELTLGVSRVLQASGRFANGETLLKKVADSGLDSAEAFEARRSLARAYLERGNYQAARFYWEHVLSKYGDDAEALAGVISAMRNMSDLRGLASVYARQIAAGGNSEDMRANFLGVLEQLVELKDYESVANSTRQALSSPAVSGAEFIAEVKRLEASSVPEYLKSCVAMLGDADGAVRARARDALASFGAASAGVLVEGLESEDQAVRSACLELLSSLAGGGTFEFDAAKPPEGRKEALARWQAWLASQKPPG